MIYLTSLDAGKSDAGDDKIDGRPHRHRDPAQKNVAEGIDRWLGGLTD